MKRLLSLLILLPATTLMAGNRSLAEMQAIAASKLNTLTAERSQRNAPVHSDDIQCVADKETYTVFSSEAGTGFVIVAKSTLADPIIGYAEGSFHANTMPPAMQWYLNEVSRNLEAIDAGKAYVHRAASYTPVKNFITTNWDQMYPFNQLTPSNYPAGCVATALAQCLNYYQYPTSVEFDATYSITTNDKTERKNAHVSSTYNWPYKNTYKRTTYSDNIDELLRDCGYAVYMDYAEDGSGSSIAYAGSALTQLFGYPEQSVKFYTKSGFNGTQDDWKQIIYDEMAIRSPIIYGAHSADFGGHAFILSGIDSDGLVYVNWGWGGKSNGFFNMDLLCVDSMLFMLNHSMVTGIRTTPLDTDLAAPRIWVNTGEPYTFRWGKEREGKGKFRNTLYIDMPGGFANISPCTFQGVFGLFAEDLTDGSTWVIAEDLQDPDTLLPNYGYYLDEREEFYYYYYIDGANGLKEGHTYRMSFGTKDINEGTWHSIICDGGEIGYDITYTGDPNTCTVSEKPTSVPVLTGISPLHTSPKAEEKIYNLAGQRIAVPSGGTVLPKGVYIINGKKTLMK